MQRREVIFRYSMVHLAGVYVSGSSLMVRSGLLGEEKTICVISTLDIQLGIVIRPL